MIRNLKTPFSTVHLCITKGRNEYIMFISMVAASANYTRIGQEDYSTHEVNMFNERIIVADVF